MENYPYMNDFTDYALASEVIGRLNAYEGSSIWTDIIEGAANMPLTESLNLDKHSFVHAGTGYVITCNENSVWQMSNSHTRIRL